MSNEKEIREAVKEYLDKNYEDVFIKEEFGLFLDSRNDVMGILCNPFKQQEIISIEIKSDKDNFSRLEKQLNTYLTYSTLVYVALDISHLKKYQKNYSTKFPNIGILYFENNKLKLLKNPIRKEFRNLYFLLTAHELTIFFIYFKGKTLIPKDYKTSQFLIKNIFTEDEIFEISKSIFLSSFNPSAATTFPKYLIKDFNKKQELFIEWLKEENWNMYNKNSLFWVKNRNIKKEKLIRSSLKNI